MRLSRGREHGMPDGAFRIETFLLGCQEFDRDMNEAVVQEPDHQAGLPGHGGMGSMPRELIAKNRVFGIVRTAPNDVARVKVAHDEGNVPRLKPLFDLLVQESPDVTQLDVSRRVAFRCSVSE